MKKGIGFLLSLMLSLCIALPVTGMQVPQIISSMDSQYSQQVSAIELDGQWISSAQLDALEVHPGSELNLYLISELGNPLFFDQNAEPISNADATLSRMRAAQVYLKADLDDNAAVSSIELAYSYKTDQLASATPYIHVEFSRTYRGEDYYFSLPVAMGIEGRAFEETTFYLSGVMRTDTTTESADNIMLNDIDEAIHTSSQDLEEVQLWVGDNILIRALLPQDERYHGTVEIYEKTYIDGRTLWIYELSTMNLDRQDTTVRIRSDQLMQVYDSAGLYIGTTEDDLPYSDKYILAAALYDPFYMDTIT